MHHHGLSEWAVVCFTVNVIMGSGFLDVPHAMMESGVILGVIVLVVVTILQWLAACMLAEVVARSHALLTKSDFNVSPVLQPLAKREYDSASRENLGAWAKGLPLLDVPSETSFEIMALCRLHLGRVVEGIIGFFLLLYLVGTLWSYADVFASALASSVPVMGINQQRTCAVYLESSDGGEPVVTTDPECLALYYTWCGIFATSMAFLCVFELEEQVAFQVGNRLTHLPAHYSAGRHLHSPSAWIQHRLVGSLSLSG
jgi:amino acid permease